jgi:serine/threonine protein phosphatase PrpC
VQVLNIQMASRTSAGARAYNEDDLRYGQADGVAFAVLADGAGGHRDGAVASDLVVRLMTMGLQSARDLQARELDELARSTHLTLVEQASARPERDRMHATLVALWVDVRGPKALWTHVGDSRLYLLRQGVVHHVTRDDSVVRRMLDAGMLTAEEALRHPRKNQLLAAMGAEGPFAAHTLEKPFGLRDGDALLLCTDGWWESLGDRDIEQVLDQSSSAADWLDRMASRIRAAAVPGQDNFSAVALWVGDPTEVTRFGAPLA